MKNKGIFITFEGPDGSGKTTASQNVYQKLIQLGYDVVYTREPGGIGISEQIRDIILDPKNTMMDRKTEALLYAASRRQHLVEKIIPALTAGKIVLCDRFVDSSLAYQGYGREIGADEVYQINEFAIEGVMPDITFFLSVSAEKGLERISGRKTKDRLDQESLAFHQKVYDGYQAVLEQFKERMIVVDAQQSIETVTQTIVQEITKRVSKNV